MVTQLTDKDRQAASPALVLQDISKRYGGIHALTGVGLTLRSGEVLALAGDNGAGKSTLVKIVSGTIMPDAGSLVVDGREVSFRSAADAAHHGVQTVYQDLALCDNLDTIQNLYLGRERRSSGLRLWRLRRSEMEQEAAEVLAQLGVKIRRFDVPVGSLSGGQRQSVAVCRALLSDPKVVLLDEPTAALGVVQRKEVMALIERLREQGRAVLLVSHDLGDVQRLADRVVVLRLGHRVAELERGYRREDLLSAITGAENEEAAR